MVQVRPHVVRLRNGRTSCLSRTAVGPCARVIHRWEDASLSSVLPSQNRCMGIRYYAYAFDSDQTEEALADPLTVIGADPLADAWGLEPGFTQGVTEFRQSLPERDLLYLDKAWPHLQWLSAPRSSSVGARAAYRMFDGQVTYADDGLTWRPWVRALPPHEVALIAWDLETISDLDIKVGLDGFCSSRQALEFELPYAAQFLHRARVFVHTVASEGRGFAYMIG
jgi:hypothetical protein